MTEVGQTKQVEVVLRFALVLSSFDLEANYLAHQNVFVRLRSFNIVGVIVVVVGRPFPTPLKSRTSRE